MRKTLIVCVAVLTALAMVAPAAVAADGTGAVTADATTVAQEEPTCEYPLELEDATGQEVTIDEEPDSVVALGPSDAQILFEIGAEEKVVGIPVGPSTDYLDADEDLDVSQADGTEPVLEEVVDRDPDVVLAANIYQNREVIDQLRESGLTVYVFPSGESLDDVSENVRLAGEIVGECDGAEETLGWMDERLGIVEAAVEDEDRPLAYYAMPGGWTAGPDTFQHEILATAGVENLGAEAGIDAGTWDQLSEEVVVEEDPEWIVYEDTQDEPPVGDAVTATAAVQEEQFVEVNTNYMNQPGPRVVYAIEEIVQEVHPEAYAEAEAELQGTDGGDGTDDATDDADDEAADDATDDGADDTIPGFGVPVAIAALLATLAVRVRRA